MTTIKSLLIALAEISDTIILIQITLDSKVFVQFGKPFTKEDYDILHSKFQELQPDYYLDVETQLCEGEYEKQLPRQYGQLETICIEIKD